MNKRHYLNEDGSRWYIKINNKSDELNILYEINVNYVYERSNFPYYVVLNEDTGIEQTYSALKE